MNKNKLYNEEYVSLIEQLPNYEEYQYWDFLQDRKIIFNQDIDLSIVNRAVLNIIKWNEEDEKNNIPINERKKITIYVSSNGGCVISGLSLINAIEKSKTPVETIGIAVCASMGALLLISGHTRKCYKDTTILLHDGSLTLQSTSKKAKQTMEYYDKLDERLGDFVVSKTKITKELYEEKEDEEWYLFGDEALELGIVDEII